MTIGPEPMIKIFSMSLLLGMRPPFAVVKEAGPLPTSRHARSEPAFFMNRLNKTTKCC